MLLFNVTPYTQRVVWIVDFIVKWQLSRLNVNHYTVCGSSLGFSLINTGSIRVNAIIPSKVNYNLAISARDIVACFYTLTIVCPTQSTSDRIFLACVLCKILSLTATFMIAFYSGWCGTQIPTNKTGQDIQEIIFFYFKIYVY